jgi:hypothetical protein
MGIQQKGTKLSGQWSSDLGEESRFCKVKNEIPINVRELTLRDHKKGEGK